MVQLRLVSLEFRHSCVPLTRLRFFESFEMLADISHTISQPATVEAIQPS